MPLGSQAFCQAVDTGRAAASEKDRAPDRACVEIGSGAADEIAQNAPVGNRHAASAQVEPSFCRAMYDVDWSDGRKPARTASWRRSATRWMLRMRPGPIRSAPPVWKDPDFDPAPRAV